MIHYKQYQTQLQATIKGESLMNDEQANCSMFNHLLVSQEIYDYKFRTVSIQNLDSFEAYQGIKYLDDISCLNSALVSNTSASVFNLNGNIGPEFLIATTELRYLLLNNGYRLLPNLNEYILAC